MMGMESKMMKKRWALATLAVATLLSLMVSAIRAQSDEGQLTEEFHQSYPLGGDGRLSLSNINGKVSITGWDRNEVKVDAVKRARTAEALSAARIKVDAASTHVRIETEYDGRFWDNRGDGDGKDRQAALVEYTLSVPRTARVEDVNVVNGALEIQNFAGPVEAASVNGAVKALGLSGRVELSVVNGHLEASLDNLSAANPVSLSSVNGQLVVTIPSDASAHLKATTVHGSIKNDFGLPVREGRYVGRDLEGQLGAGGARVELSNVNGTVSILRASDNKPLGPVRNLLSETREAEDFAFEDETREADRKARSASRTAEREARSVSREAARESAQVHREAVIEARKTAAASAREAAQIAREATRATRDIERQVRQEMNRNMNGNGDDWRRQIERDSAVLATSGVPRVRIETFDGSITVHAWDKAEVKASIIKRAFDEREMKGIKVSSVVNPGQGGNSDVNIRADFDKTLANGVVKNGDRIVSWNSSASVEMDVFVPRSSTLIMSSGDGRLLVEGVRGQIELRTGDGPIDVTGAEGRVSAHTGDGRILIEGFEGEAEARTGDGRITLDGNFRQLSAHTGDGTISLALPEGANATIETDAESVSSDGVAEAEEANEEKRVRRWKVGSGGQVFTLRAGDGRIIIRRR
jgi:DUF4097 and DUF4098 domain-containing protein YvlB